MHARRPGRQARESEMQREKLGKLELSLRAGPVVLTA